MKRDAKGAGLKVVTGNWLATGAVVFRTAAGTWSHAIDEAAVAETADEAEALNAAALADAERNIVVDTYLVDVRREGGRIVPVLLREAIRAAGGPTASTLHRMATRTAA